MWKVTAWTMAAVTAMAPTLAQAATETLKVPETRDQMLIIPVGAPPMERDGKTSDPLEFLYYGFSDATKQKLAATPDEAKIRKACTPVQHDSDEAKPDDAVLAVAPAVAAAAVAVVTWAVGKAIDWVVAKVDAKLKAEIEKYNHGYSAAMETAAYQSDKDGNPVMSFTCLRISRLIFEGEKKDKIKDVAFDLVVQVSTVGASGQPSDRAIGLKWRPIRLFVNNRGVTPPLAKFDDKTASVSYAAKLTATSTWRGDVSGGQGQVFDLDLGAWTADLKFSDFAYKLLLDDSKAVQLRPGLDPKPLDAWNDWSTAPITPMFPVSNNDGGGKSFPNGHAVFSASVAESTAVPKLLKAMQKLFSDNKETIAKELKSVAEKRIGDLGGGS